MPHKAFCEFPCTTAEIENMSAGGKVRQHQPVHDLPSNARGVRSEEVLVYRGKYIIGLTETGVRPFAPDFYFCHFHTCLSFLESTRVSARALQWAFRSWSTMPHASAFRVVALRGSLSCSLLAFSPAWRAWRSSFAADRIHLLAHPGWGATRRGSLRDPKRPQESHE